MEKVLNVLVKGFALGVTTPASIAVVSGLFADYPPLIRAVIVVCGVGLVEGVFLGAWLGVEQKRAEGPEFKIRPVVSVWVMYAALLGIGFAHGEGFAAVPLRLALGLALAGATWDTLLYGWSKATARADKDITTSARVRREARKQAERVEVARIHSQASLDLQGIAHRERVEGTRLTKQSGRELRKVEQEFADSPVDSGANTAETSVRADVRRKPARTKAERLELARGFRADGRTVADYQQAAGLGKTTAYEDWKAVEMVVASNGNGRH